MTGMMQYIDAPQQQPQADGAGKYHGAIAKGYDQKREQSDKWIVEQRVIEGMLRDLPQETVVLDCPVGTGRFIPFYIDRGFHILGMDISEDMLREAAKKAEGRNAVGELRVGDVRQTGLPGACVDVAVNCRISRWLSPEDCQRMFREMQRVARKRIIWTARVANHPHARTRELFEAALQPGWAIARDEAGYVLDYRILCADRRA